MTQFIIHGECIQIYAGTLSRNQFDYWATRSNIELFENLTCQSTGCQQAGDFNLGGNFKNISDIFQGKYLSTNNTKIISEGYSVKNLDTLTKDIRNIEVDRCYWIFTAVGEAVYNSSVNDTEIDYTKFLITSNIFDNYEVIKNISYSGEELVLSELSSNYHSSNVRLISN
jgi:hypothetical protein